MVDAAISHPCARSGWGGSSYLGSFWRTGSGQKTTKRMVVDPRGGDGSVLRCVPRKVVDGVADSVWGLTVPRVWVRRCHQIGSSDWIFLVASSHWSLGLEREDGDVADC
ncbi:hypothetical protein M0R45_027466 [Rubus argutus]|uniref:Uncharacterized protein n=1 Tax=Rubus argutus TaxID=59490 RepID=A0AAW1X149_RUBAR